MRVVHGLDSIDPPLSRSILTIGNFDGVHRGHQEIVAETARLARLTGAPAVVLTFEPHPLTIVSPDRTPARLTPPVEKIACLERAGAELIVIARSDPALLGLEAAEFIQHVVRARFHPIHMVEGQSFGFGRGRRGNIELLQKFAGDFGCDVHVVEPVEIVDGDRRLVVSSSLVRTLLKAGDVSRAALCLGRPYALLGNVVHGAHRGGELGFPTANVRTEDQLAPAEGVYAGSAVVLSARHQAAISIGRSPTFGGFEMRIEAHLLDYSGDLYGREIRLEFQRFLRHQRKFDSVDELVEQVRKDITQARAR